MEWILYNIQLSSPLFLQTVKVIKSYLANKQELRMFGDRYVSIVKSVIKLEMLVVTIRNEDP